MKKINAGLTSYALALIILLTSGCGRAIEEDEELYPFETGESIESVIDSISELTPLDDSETETKKFYYMTDYKQGYDLPSLIKEYNYAYAENDAVYCERLLGGIGTLVLGENIINATGLDRNRIIKVVYDHEFFINPRAVIYVANSKADLDAIKKDGRSYEDIPYTVHRYELSDELTKYYKDIDKCIRGQKLSLEEIDEISLEIMDLLLRKSKVDGKNISSELDPQKVLVYENSNK